jgi:hypothetical protein
VPAVPVGLEPIATRPIDHQPLSTSNRGEAKRDSKENISATGSLKSLLNETTVKKPSGSGTPANPKAMPLRSGQSDLKLSPAAKSQTVSETIKIDPSPLVDKSHWRIDAAHADSPGPHSATDMWLERSSNWLSNVLQQRGVLAMALIIAGVVGIAIVLHNRAQRHALRPNTDPAVNASRNDLKSDGRFPEAATGAPTGQNSQTLIGARPASADNSNGMYGNVPLNQQPTRTAVAGQAPLASGPQYRAQESRMGYSESAPSQPEPWRVPSGANMPASVAPMNTTSQPNSAANMPGMPQQSYYSAQRGTSLPAGSAGFTPGGSPSSAAAFDGNINNPSLPISR